MKNITKRNGETLLELTGADAISFAEKWNDNKVLVNQQN